MSQNKYYKGDLIKRQRLLLVTNGLNGSTLAERKIACCLRDAGFEVVYVGGPLSPEAITTSAMQEGVDLICLATVSDMESSLRRNIVGYLDEFGSSKVNSLEYTSKAMRERERTDM